ncbi:MAG: (Fe-S)-binding protein [Verrucomicrobiales bacterium]
MLHTIDTAKFGPLGQTMADAIQSCVHCGFCLPACPTYQKLGHEVDSPRGRILLMKGVLEEELELEQALPHLDQCLGCLACEPACPSGVPYRDLISPFRALANEKRTRSPLEKLRRTLISQTLPYPNRFRLGAKAGKIGKALSPLMPASFRPMLDLIPDTLPKKQTWKEFYPAHGDKRGTVALLIGCAQQVLDPDINTATIECLIHNGIDVHIPKNQTCCGALSWHVGDQSAAQKFAQKNLKAFDPEKYDAIITNAAGCGSGLHEYHLILKGTPFEKEADNFRDKVIDVTAYLHQLGDLTPFNETGQKQTVAYHDACHLSHAQGVTAAPRALLAAIPGVTVAEIPNPHLCCGSAGTYNIDQPEIASSLGQNKAKAILSTKPDLIATGNIGCLTQITSHLKTQGRPIPIRHTIQILRDAWST